MGFFDNPFESISDYVSEPFKKLAHGDPLGGFEDALHKFTPVGIASDAIGGLSVRHVNVANKSSVPVTVVVTADPRWALLDLSANILQAVASGGLEGPAAGTQVLKLLREARTLTDIYKAIRFYRAVGGIFIHVYAVFEKSGATIEPGTYVDVHQRSNSNPLNHLDPSQKAAMAGASDLTMMMMRPDGHTAYFNTNSDTSWIALEQGYCRAKYGAIWQIADGPHAWDA